MPQTSLSHGPREEDTDDPAEPGLILGRPVEDRGFEAVEVTIGIAAGLTIGSAVAGPIGTAVGGLIGAAAGIVAAESLERAVGPAATTTNAGGPEPHRPA